MRLGQDGVGFQGSWSASSLGETEKKLQEKECNKKNAEMQRYSSCIRRQKINLLTFVLRKQEYIFCHTTKVMSFSYNLFHSDDVCQERFSHFISCTRQENYQLKKTIKKFRAFLMEQLCTDKAKQNTATTCCIWLWSI